MIERAVFIAPFLNRLQWARTIFAQSRVAVNATIELVYPIYKYIVDKSEKLYYKMFTGEELAGALGILHLHLVCLPWVIVRAARIQL